MARRRSIDAAHTAAHRVGIRVLSNRRPACRPSEDAADRDALAPEVRTQRQTVQQQVQKSRDEIDAFTDLVALVTTPYDPGVGSDHRSRLPSVADHGAGQVPRSRRRSSSTDRRPLVSRFAFNLPEDLTARASVGGRAQLRLGCLRGGGAVLRGGAPRSARRAARSARTPGRDPLGSIVVHAMPRLREPAVHPSRKSVRGAAAAGRSAARRGGLGARHRVRRLRMEPHGRSISSRGRRGRWPTTCLRG